MVVRLDPKAETATIVSFPRDLWVEIPGHGNQRINAAIQFDDGKPDLLIDTLKQNFDIEINHYLEVNFAAFREVVGAIGGVRVYISHPMRDGRSQLNIPQAGCQTLDQVQALAYARSRALQWQDLEGRWHTDGTGDLGRIKRQQDFVRRTIGQAIDRGARNPATLARLVSNTVDDVTLDPETTAQDLIDLGRAFDNFAEDDLQTVEIPVVDATRGGADVLLALEPQTDQVLAPFRGTGTPDGEGNFDPSTITVRVANGTDRLDEGALTTDRFQALGFAVLDPIDAPAPVWQTIVTYHPTAEPQARFVARYLDGDPLLQADEAQGSEILVTTGPDLLGVLDTPKPSSEELGSVTTSTSSTSTTSTSTPTVTSTTAAAPAGPVEGPGPDYDPNTLADGADC